MAIDLNTNKLKPYFVDGDIALIREEFLRAAELTKRFIPVGDVEVKFLYTDGFLLNGVQGHSENSHLIYMFYNPGRFFLRTEEGRIYNSAVVAHELHHTARRVEIGSDFCNTVGQVIISEGFAQKFQRETGHPFYTFEWATQDGALSEWAKKAESFLNKPWENFKTTPWQFEELTEQQKVQYHRYALGISIVDGWSKYSGVSATQAYAVPAEDILNPWLQGKFQMSQTPAGPN